MDNADRTGAISFVELAATDVGQQGRFYAELMGWTSVPVGDGHAVMVYDDRVVAGIRAIHTDDGYSDPDGTMSAWSIYVDVDDVDRVCARAIAIGGNVWQDPTALDGDSRVAVIADPAGAPLCVIDGTRPGQLPMFDEPGAPCWFESMSTDAAAAVPFYQDIFGWHAVKNDESPMDYWAFVRTGEAFDDGQGTTIPMSPIAGLMQYPPETPPETQSVWQVSFSIHTDIDTFVAKATALGGEVQMGPLDSPFGAGCMLTDPAGAFFVAFDRSRITAV